MGGKLPDRKPLAVIDMRRVLSAAAGVSALVLAGFVLLKARKPRTNRSHGTRSADRPPAVRQESTKFDSQIVAGIVQAIKERRPLALLSRRYIPARGTALASTSVLVLMLLLCLGSIGVVHGLWSKNLTIDGVAETGDLNADWDKIRTKDRCGQTKEAEISPSAHRVTVLSNTLSGGSGGYGDQDGGDDNPCPPDPCTEGGQHYSTTSGGGGDHCSYDPCEHNGYRSGSAGTTSGSGDPCPCEGGSHTSDTTHSGGEYDPCPPDPCEYGGHSSGTTFNGGGGDPCPPDPCQGGSYTAATTSGGGGGHDHDDDGGDACPPSCDIAIGGIGDDAEHGNQIAYVDIDYATPGYWCKVMGWVSNLGSIPFNIVGINAILDSENDKGISFHDLNGSQPGVCKLVDEDGHGTAERQVDPGEEGIVYCKILVDQNTKTCTKWHNGHCEEWSYTGGAEYGWTYHFAIEVCVAQWNEDPSPGGESEDLDACKHPSTGTHEGPDTPVLPTPGPANNSS